DQVLDQAGVGRLEALGDGVEGPHQVAVVQPVGPHRDVQVLVGAAQGLGVQPGQAALAAAAQAGQDGQPAPLDADVEVDQVLLGEVEAVVLDDVGELGQE